jgi:hypothetical protein
MSPSGDGLSGEPPPQEDSASLKLPAEALAALKRMRDQQEMVKRLFESSAIKAIAERAQEQQKLATQLLASPAMRVLAEHAVQRVACDDGHFRARGLAAKLRSRHLVAGMRENGESWAS